LLTAAVGSNEGTDEGSIVGDGVVCEVGNTDGLLLGYSEEFGVGITDGILVVYEGNAV
jgi:hypothetical protein